jgi:hypothetical protein
MMQQAHRQMREQYLGQTLERPKGSALDALIRTQGLTLNCEKGSAKLLPLVNQCQQIAIPSSLSAIYAPQVHHLGQSVGWVAQDGISTNGRGRRSGSPDRGSGMSPDGTDVFTRPAPVNR